MNKARHGVMTKGTYAVLNFKFRSKTKLEKILMDQ